MRSLLAVQRARVSLPLPTCLADVSFDTVGGSLVCAFVNDGGEEDSSSIEVIKLDPARPEPEILAAWDLPPGAIVRSARYFADADQCVIVLAQGDIFTVDGASGSVALSGSIDPTHEITTASWSPDEEILVLATAAPALVLLSRDIEFLTETAITTADHASAAATQVSAGWGSKKTQFEGKGAKAAALRDPTVPIVVDAGKLSHADDSRVRISWRGDGKFFAVNSIDKIDNHDDHTRRSIRVYARDGTLDSVSEPVNGLESFLSWRPSGNLITGLQRTSESLQVVFFERNGLRRGEFSLRLPADSAVLDLAWNQDSSVLAVVLPNAVQLWTVNNYYWYLKQHLPLFENNELSFIRWHPDRPLTMIAAANEADSVEYLEFTPTVFAASSSGSTAGLTAVADGTTVKLTPLATANTPPPMSFKDLTVSSAPVAIAVGPISIAALQTKLLEVAAWPSLEPVASISLAQFELSNPRQVQYITRTVVAVVFDNLDTTASSSVVLFDLLATDPAVPLHSQTFTPAAVAITACNDNAALVVELATGQIEQIIINNNNNMKEHEISVESLLALPERCLSIAAVKSVSGQTFTFGLTAAGRLYCNSQRVAVACTSFLVTDTHLVFTTTQSLRFIHLQTDAEGDVLSVPSDDDAAAGDERCRAIERGSKLVAVIPTKLSVVLQAPRGNLETIFPRILVLDGVRRHIDNREYQDAFKSCRVHRINLDILYDYAPEVFMQNVELFVSQLSSVEYLDLFLSNLTNSDVTKTIYKETLPSALGKLNVSSSSLSPSDDNKVNQVCDAILNVLIKSYTTTHTQSIITAHVCKQPPDVEAALILIATFMDQDKLTSAVEHICFLQDVNKLYDAALGLYDLRLALLLARQSQKDPREYLPFLENLQKQVPLRRRFLLDSHLGRYAKALTHLCELKYDEQGHEVFSEVERFVVDHELYRNALSIFKYEPVKQYAILKLYAHYLKANNQFKDAGLAYETLGAYDDALESYVLGTNWREAFAVCSLSHKSHDEVHEIAGNLAESLVQVRNFRDAATIHQQYRFDVKESIRTLCKGFYYSEAIRKALLHNEPRLLTEIIDPAVVDGFNQITELLSDCRSQLEAQISRLRELRVKKAADPVAFYYDTDRDQSTNGIDIPDNVSIAPSEISTSASVFTRYTGKTSGTAGTGATRRTAKNRRREERKRARGKKGSVYEEEYLVNSINRLIDRVNETRNEARRLVEALSRRSMRERAVQVQRQYVDLIALLKSCVTEVFTISERDRQRFDDDGNLYLVPELPTPTVHEFEKLYILDYD
ncbi:IKI3 family-domain-containing protein [Lipomyces japonicus]|uniref:IKI3 family-domain-containing protein n=1 Tax=Lipomyces japonicus TaxID=56871 RepID=UPI0034CF555F